MPNNIAVVLPVYNAEKWIGQTLLSVCHQTLFEFLHLYIGIDGATDDSLAVVKKIIDYQKIKKITIFNSKINLGKHAMLNTLIQDYVKEDLFFLLDSDDLLMPECLETLVNKLNQHPDLSGVRAGMLFFEKEQIKFFETYPDDVEIFRLNLNYLGMGMFAHTGSLWKRDVFMKTIPSFKALKNSHKEKLARMASEDFFRIQLLNVQDRKFLPVNYPLMLYRLHEKQWSANSNPFEGSDLYDRFFRNDIPFSEFDFPRVNRPLSNSTRKYLLNNYLKNIVYFLKRKKTNFVFKNLINLWGSLSLKLGLYFLISLHVLVFCFLHRHESPERIFVRLEWWYPKTLKPVCFLKETERFVSYLKMIQRQESGMNVV